MKNQIMIAAIASAALLVTGCKEETKADPEVVVEKEFQLDSLEKKVSYIFGYNMATRTKSMDFTLDAEAMVLAINDINGGKESRITEEEMRATMVAFQADQQAKRQEKANKEASENTAKGQAFLAENAKKEGVVQTESGLQYRVITEGTGAIPKVDDKVVVHYRGTLLDGTEFDSSIARGEPARFTVGQLIPGWIEALQLMKTGSKWEIYVPSDLAYGPGGTGKIGPNSTLIFEMELLEILKPEVKPEK